MTRRRLRVAILGSGSSWHGERLARALATRGHDYGFVAATRLVSHIEDGVKLRGNAEIALEACDAVIVRGIPTGSLEQVIFRVDSLHALAACGVRTVNSAHAIERTVDKFLASALLSRAGVPTPRTIVCERRDDALAAFDRLGGDVIIKPVFGAMGLGMARLEDPHIAYRVFRALELERAVYYLQETLDHDGTDIRAFVIGGRIVAAIKRLGTGWRVNLARGARAEPTRLDDAQQQLCLRSAAVLGTEYAGVDLAETRDGKTYVIEVNGIPGWQGLEQATGVDVAAVLVDHLEGLPGYT
jgi:RimK family alpha-L-glutamate ligase